MLLRHILGGAVGLGCLPPGPWPAGGEDSRERVEASVPSADAWVQPEAASGCLTVRFAAEPLDVLLPDLGGDAGLDTFGDGEGDAGAWV